MQLPPKLSPDTRGMTTYCCQHLHLIPESRIRLDTKLLSALSAGLLKKVHSQKHKHANGRIASALDGQVAPFELFLHKQTCQLLGTI
jgi:hypothetical protein